MTASTTENKKRILLVDDEPFILGVMKSFLDGSNFEIESAACGNDALTLIKEKDYSCVVTDVRMPNGTGPQLMASVREINRVSPSIVFVTGYSDVPPEDLLSRGGDSYIMKPFNVDDFSREIRRMTKPLDERLAERPASYEALRCINMRGGTMLAKGGGDDIQLGRGGFFTVTPLEGLRTTQNLRFAIDVKGGDPIKGCGRILWTRRQSSINPLRAGAGILIEYLENDSRDRYLEFVAKASPVETIPKDIV